MYKDYGINTTLVKPVTFKTFIIKMLTINKKNETILLTHFLYILNFSMHV